MQDRNQPPPLVDYNLLTSDPVLENALETEGAGWARPAAEAFGRVLGTEETIRLGFEANENPPVLGPEDRVDFHASWHELMRLSVEHRLHNLPWHDGRTGAHVARAALMFLASQNEAGHTCPTSMTHSAEPALRREPEVAG